MKMKLQNIVLAIFTIVIVWLYFSLTEKENEIIDLKIKNSEHENRIKKLDTFIEVLNIQSNERQNKIDSLLEQYKNIPTDDKVKDQNPITPVRFGDDWGAIISPIERAIDNNEQ